MYYFNIFFKFFIKFWTPKTFFSCFFYLPIYQTLSLKKWLGEKKNLIEDVRRWCSLIAVLLSIKIGQNSRIQFCASQSPLWSESKFLVSLMHQNSNLVHLSLQNGSATYFRVWSDNCMFSELHSQFQKHLTCQGPQCHRPKALVLLHLSGGRTMDTASLCIVRV